METLFQFVAPPSQCGYLPEQLWSLEYEIVSEITSTEYMDRMASGWRRFGNMIFRPRCPNCNACRSLRVLADQFQPNRSQRRVARQNNGLVHVTIQPPTVTREKLALYDRYHLYQTLYKSWPEHPAKDEASYAGSFVENPFPTEEWCYYIGNRLVGVGYVDCLPCGMSAIYFYYDPDYRCYSLGTYNVLKIIEECAARGIPHVYLGYYVADCASLCYKANFAPNELLDAGGIWRRFR